MSLKQQLEKEYVADVASADAAYEMLMKTEERMHLERMDVIAEMRKGALARLSEKYGITEAALDVLE